MALSRQHPFGFPRTPFDEMFDMPAFAFPRTDLTPFRANVLNSPSSDSFWRHPYQVSEDDKTYTLSVDVPGVRPEDMSIEINDDNVLHLRGGRRVESEDGHGFSERKFDYRMTLGANIDKDNFAASMQDGVLKLTAPKMDAKKPASRVIKITTGETPMQPAEEKKE